MTELALNPAANAALAPAANLTATTVSLMEWAQELQAAHALGTALCSTEFVPQAFRGKPESAAAAILAGKSLGLDPMNSLANIFVVHGRPAMYARTMAALVLAAGHTIRRVAATEQSVIFEGRRKGDAGPFTRVEWSIARAQQAGYLSNAKYKSNPIEMLTAKCQAELCRVIAPDVLTGIAASSVEEAELENIGELEEQSNTPAPAKKPVQRRQRQAPAPVAPAAVADAPRDETPVDAEADALAEAADDETGELPAEEPQDDAEQSAESLCTPEQQKALGDALKAAGYTGRVNIINRVSQFAGRTIGASKELTETEAIDLTGQLWEEADNAAPTAEPEPAA